MSRPRAAAGAFPFFGVYVRSGNGPFWWRACGWWTIPLPLVVTYAALSRGARWDVLEDLPQIAFEALADRWAIRGCRNSAVIGDIAEAPEVLPRTESRLFYCSNREQTATT